MIRYPAPGREQSSLLSAIASRVDEDQSRVAHAHTRDNENVFFLAFARGARGEARSDFQFEAELRVFQEPFETFCHLIKADISVYRNFASGVSLMCNDIASFFARKDKVYTSHGMVTRADMTQSRVLIKICAPRSF